MSRAGIYRITGATLQAHGYTWIGLPIADLAVISRAGPVPRFVSGTRRLTAASYVEFYGEPASSRYTRTNVYTLRIDHASALPTETIDGTPDSGAVPSTFIATASEASRHIYEPLASGDGWMYTALTAIAQSSKSGLAPQPTSHSARLSLPGLQRVGTSTLQVRLIGTTDIEGTGPQHHLTVSVDGHAIAEIRFSGAYADRTLTSSFPTSFLASSHPTIRFRLPDDIHNKLGADGIDIRSFSISYPRAFGAESGRLGGRFPSAPHVRIGKLRDTQVAIWRTAPGRPARILHARVHPTGGQYAAAFEVSEPGSYAISDAQALLHPTAITPVPDTSGLLLGKATLLAIGPRPFLEALQPLLDYHRKAGTLVKAAPLDAIYARYSGGTIDPKSIESYIAEAAPKLGLKDVLLVGADTYDPRHHLKCTAKDCPANPKDLSFVPSLYARDQFFGQIPSDERYVDTPLGPSLAIARVPAVDETEIKRYVTRALAYLRAAHPPHAALFAAGAEEPDFTTSSDAIAATLPATYLVNRVYASNGGQKAARSAFKTALASRVGIVNFVGHGNLEQWGKPPSLLNTEDVQRLASPPASGLYFGWGCQTAYHIDPTDRSLDATLLLAPNGPAVVTVGSTGLDLPAPQAFLALTFFNELFHDPVVSTVGDAWRAAERSALHDDPTTASSITSYELFGDPLLPLAPLQ